MGNTIYNFGTYNDHHTDNSKHITANVSSPSDLNRLMHNFFNDNPEDIQAEDVHEEEPPQPKENKPAYFPLLTEQCRKEGKIDKVETELGTACKGSATCLWSVIHVNEALGYVATNHLDAQDVYNAFTDYFGELPYNVRNFRGARNKK